MEIKQIPETQNEAWGFFGTMEDRANAAWPLAMIMIANATEQSFESVRLFLDSTHGRHFADDVLNEMFKGYTIHDAVDATVTRWMEWTIGRVTSRDYGIPRGLPYLTGFVIHCAIIEDKIDA